MILGDSAGFRSIETPLRKKFPDNIEVGVRLSNGAPFATSFVQGEVPKELARTGRVLDYDRESVSADEFVDQIQGEYC
ncbi:hypothetical protein Sru01_69820 [Sphaerisporangium rufum]|uniref:Uncharacterized protein n=1 Tax=Sphaerisporangium rufum TaxID=1381558 RepID=A0A919RC43_9ACTN|nr:hypothetical protein Sru01_69820 [Sphaerisporangium rufum]